MNLVENRWLRFRVLEIELCRSSEYLIALITFQKHDELQEVKPGGCNVKLPIWNEESLIRIPGRTEKRCDLDVCDHVSITSTIVSLQIRAFKLGTFPCIKVGH